MTDDITSIMMEHPALKLIQDGKKVHCVLSGHDMSASCDIITAYVNGKKYRKLLDKQLYDYAKYKQHFSAGVKRHRRHQLFCALTLRHLNNNPEHIQRHLEGRRFQKAVARWEHCEKTGEVFKARLGRAPRQPETDSDAEDEDKDVDDMQDLYPADHIKKEEVLDEDEDEEDGSPDDNEEVEQTEFHDTVNVKVEAVETSGEKRKRKGGKLKSKKMSKKLKKVPAVTS